MDVAKAIAAEMLNADEMLLSLAGEDIDTLSVNSLEAEDAPFLVSSYRSSVRSSGTCLSAGLFSSSIASQNTV